MIKIAIGTEPSQLIPCEILKHSIRQNTSSDVVFYESWTAHAGWHPLLLKPENKRISGTRFSPWRWLIPDLLNHTGVGIYLDADQAVFADIAELARYPREGKMIACVVGAEGTFGNQQRHRSNVETSVMAIDCERCDWKPSDMFAKVRLGDWRVAGDHPVHTDEPKSSHYSRMMQAKWISWADIDHLPKTWNHFNQRAADTKLSHWSKIAEQPWKAKGFECNPARDEWLSCLRDAIDQGVIDYDLLKQEVDSGHIAAAVLEYAYKTPYVTVHDAKLIQKRPTKPVTKKALVGKVTALKKAGQTLAACQLLDKFLGRTKSAELHYLSATLHAELGNVVEAKQAFEAALALKPQYVDAAYGFAKWLHKNQQADYAKRVLDDFDQSALGFRQTYMFMKAYYLLPANIEARHCAIQAVNNADLSRANFLVLLNLMLKNKDFDGAIELVTTTSNQYVNDAQINALLALAYHKNTQWMLAQEHYQISANHAGLDAIAAINYGALLCDLKQYESAQLIYSQALKANPSSRGLKRALSHVYLAMGDFENGWRYLETRYEQAPIQIADVKGRQIAEWKGQDLGGKTLLICREEGLGDELQFVRFAQHLKQAGCDKIAWLTRQKMQSLLTMQPYIDFVIDESEIDGLAMGLDYWVMAYSVPYYLGIDSLSLTPAEPYISLADESFSTCVSTDTARPKVGLVWQGSPNHINDAHRSIRQVACLSALGDVEATWYSLQNAYDGFESDFQQLPTGTIDVGTKLHDFRSIAEVIAELEVVITIDSALAHLAAAMGKPCWLMLSAYGEDWRWAGEGNTTRWYPNNVRLFRQTQVDDWKPVIEEIKQALQKEFSVRII